MRVFFILMILSLAWINPVQTQENSYACAGVGCCCNAQQGGNWPDCAEGYECRGQRTPPYLQVCVKKGASPLTSLQLGSNQPAECKRPLTAEEIAAKSCHGVGCCCNAQAGGNFPDCDKGFECRRQTTPPHLQICIKKGSSPQAPLQLASKEPANCVAGAGPADAPPAPPAEVPPAPPAEVPPVLPVGSFHPYSWATSFLLSLDKMS